LCYENGEYLDYYIVSDDLFNDENRLEIKTIAEHGDIEINYLDDNTYLLWHYKGLTLIDNERRQDFELFEMDVYNLELAVVINDYLVVADYDQKYNFNKMYIVNLKKMTVETWKLDSDISFDSYILGIENQSIYLVDRKNEIEYELVPHKKRMRKIGTKNQRGKVLLNSKWESISLTKLTREKYSFSYLCDYEYSILNQKLYLEYDSFDTKIRVSNKDITEIVRKIDDKVYYFVDDKFYVYSPFLGERQLFSNFEWKFNTKNMVFVYKP